MTGSTLTATIHRVSDVIDLTANDSGSTDNDHDDEVRFVSSRPIPRRHSSHRSDFALDEPSAKRLKTEGYDETSNLRDYVQHCLITQVYPHIWTSLEQKTPTTTNRNQLFH